MYLVTEHVKLVDLCISRGYHRIHTHYEHHFHRTLCKSNDLSTGLDLLLPVWNLKV